MKPQFGMVQLNAAHADELIASLAPGDVDLLVLPEMAFTGYCFRNAEQIRPLCERDSDGVTVSWARRTAVRLKAYVVVGFPRIQSGSQWALLEYPSRCLTSAHVDASGGELLTNSLCVAAPDGRIPLLYDKRFLYETDERWATEGQLVRVDRCHGSCCCCCCCTRRMLFPLRDLLLAPLAPAAPAAVAATSTVCSIGCRCCCSPADRLRWRALMRAICAAVPVSRDPRHRLRRLWHLHGHQPVPLRGALLRCAPGPSVRPLPTARCADPRPRVGAAFEFAHAQLAHGAALIVLCCNWLDSAPHDDSVVEVPNYWCRRLQPLLGHRCYLIVCNRVGTVRRRRGARTDASATNRSVRPPATDRCRRKASASAAAPASSICAGRPLRRS